MRSRYRCSMCPAIHINSRSWLRSSSTHEPSDPPLRVVFRSHERGCVTSSGQQTDERPEAETPEKQTKRQQAKRRKCVRAVVRDTRVPLGMGTAPGQRGRAGEGSERTAPRPGRLFEPRADGGDREPVSSNALPGSARTGRAIARERDRRPGPAGPSQVPRQNQNTKCQANLPARPSPHPPCERETRGSPPRPGRGIRAAAETPPPGGGLEGPRVANGSCNSLMILPQVHLRKPCYDFYFL